MNITKANGLQNGHFLKISVPGLICAITIRGTASYSKQGPSEAKLSTETNKEEQTFLT